MSNFQTLNLNHTLELSPSLLLTPLISHIDRDYQFEKTSIPQKHSPKMIQSAIKNARPINSGSVHHQSFESCGEYNFPSRNCGNNQLENNKQVLFNQGYYKKINQNSLLISSLDLKLKPQKQSTPIKKQASKYFHSSNQALQKNHFTIKQPQQIIQKLINSFTPIQKTIQDHRITPKIKQHPHSDKFKQIMKTLSIQFTSSVDQNPKISFHDKLFIFWKVVDLNFFVTSEIIFKTAIALMVKYEHPLRNGGELGKFVQFLLLSDKIQLFESQQQIQMNTDNLNSNTNRGNSPQEAKLQVLSFEDITQLLTNLYVSNFKIQQSFEKFVQNIFLSFFVNSDQQQFIYKPCQQSPYLDEQLVFNNYEYHAKTSNLASFVPSYEERNHFLLDKFTQSENIFDDEQKLCLLLKLSRDPYVPRSSAKYISKINFMMGDMNGGKEPVQVANENQEEKKQRIETQKENQEVENELREWERMFGELMLRI